jgi:hypothetical protein
LPISNPTSRGKSTFDFASRSLSNNLNVMDHLVLPDGSKSWIKLAYDNPESSYYENVLDQGFSYPYFYRRVGWSYDEVWVQPKQMEDLMGGVEEGAEESIREPWEIDTFFQTWLLFGLLVEVFRATDIEVKTSDFLVPLTRKVVHKPQTARLVTTAKLPELIKQWREKHRVSRDDTVFDKVMVFIEHVGKIIDYHCAGGKDHRSIHQYGKVLWSVPDATTTAIISVAYTLRKAAYSIYNKPGKETRWPVTNSLLVYQRIQRKWCRSDAAMIMEDFDIDGQAYIASAESRSLEELDNHFNCTDHSCDAKVGDGTYDTKHDPECHEDDYEPEPSFLGHVHPDHGKKPTSLREAIMDTMDAGLLPVLRWDSDRRGLFTFGHEKQSYSEDASKTPPFVAISHV